MGEIGKQANGIRRVTTAVTEGHTLIVGVRKAASSIGEGTLELSLAGLTEIN